MGVRVLQVLTDLPSADSAVLAKRAEEFGFASYWVPEHQAIPEGSCEVYPGKEGRRAPPEYLFKMPDPDMAMLRAAAHPSEIGLGTGISLLPQRCGAQRGGEGRR